MTTPTEDEIDDLLYLARTNEVADFTQFLPELSTKYSSPHLSILFSTTDPDSGNTALHYAAANGHIDILRSVRDLASTPSPAPANTNAHNDDASGDAAPTDGAAIDPQISRLASAQNAAGNTPLHWAALNGNLEVAKALVKEWGADPRLTNRAGRDALGEAEAAGRVEVREWLGVVMGLGEADGEVEGEGSGEMEDSDGVTGEGGVSLNGESSITAGALAGFESGQSKEDIAANLEQVQNRIEELQTQDQRGKEKA